MSDEDFFKVILQAHVNDYIAKVEQILRDFFSGKVSNEEFVAKTIEINENFTKKYYDLVDLNWSTNAIINSIKSMKKNE